MKKGFTLVELALVLVVIGLLIGGLLAAQSMIASAKINSQVAQFSQLDAIVLSFKAKYNFLPGDAPMFAGDGDGLIDETEASTGSADDWNHVFVCELANFWPDADPVNYPGRSACLRPGVPPATSGAGKNLPLSKLGTRGSYILASALANNTSWAGNGFMANVNEPLNYYAILDKSQAAILSSGCCYAFTSTQNGLAPSTVKPIDLQALDRKMDDGIGNTGNVISGAVAANSTDGGIYATPRAACSNSATGVYTLSNSTAECTPLVRIGAVAGVPQ